MKEPVRILDDPSVSSTVRDHLARAHKAEVPLDVDAGMLALQGKLNAPPPTSALALKVVATVGAGAIAVAAIWWTQRPPPTQPAPPAPVPTTSAPSIIPHIDPPAESQAVDPMTLPLAVKPPAPSVQQDDPDLLRAETEHLATLRNLAKTDPAAAAAFADEGNRRFPRGALRPEREAIAVLSLARTGHADEARSRGDAFLAAHPKGPLADQVREAIGR